MLEIKMKAISKFLRSSLKKSGGFIMAKSVTPHKTLLKFGILSISTMLQDAGAISVAVVGMVAAFSNHSSASVQALVTLPSFSMMLFILLNSLAVKFFGKRNTVFIGLGLALVGGVAPAFVSNFTAIQFCRFLYGAGTGLYTPLAVSLIGDFFTGDEQRNLLGIQAAVSALGSSLMTFFAGLLVSVEWHTTFLVYLAAVPVIILFFIGYPKDSQVKQGTTEEQTQAEDASGSKRLPVLVIVGMMMLFVYFSTIMALYTNSGLAIKQLNLSNQGFLGTALSIAGLISALLTAAYGPIFKVLKHYTPVVILAIGALGFLGMSRVSNMFMFTVYAVMVSATSLLIPYVYSTVLDSASGAAKNFAISIAMVLNNLGAYVSPYVLAFLGKATGMTDPTSSFVICMVLMLFLAIVFLFLAIGRRHQAMTPAAKA